MDNFFIHLISEGNQMSDTFITTNNQILKKAAIKSVQYGVLFRESFYRIIDIMDKTLSLANIEHVNATKSSAKLREILRTGGGSKN